MREMLKTIVKTSWPIIGHLHDDVILLLRPESFRGFISYANYDFCYLNLTGITKFKYKSKNEKDCGRSSKTTQLAH